MEIRTYERSSRSYGPPVVRPSRDVKQIPGRLRCPNGMDMNPILIEAISKEQ